MTEFIGNKMHLNCDAEKCMVHCVSQLNKERFWPYLEYGQVCLQIDLGKQSHLLCNMVQSIAETYNWTENTLNCV